jgi:hypothetical protein
MADVPKLASKHRLFRQFHISGKPAWSVSAEQVKVAEEHMISPSHKHVQIITTQWKPRSVLEEGLQSYAVPEACHEAHIPHLVDDCGRGGAVPPLPLPATPMPRTVSADRMPMGSTHAAVAAARL